MALALGLGPGSAPSRAAAPDFTKEQATRGRALYGKHCATCHGSRLEGEQVSPPLTGARFDASWRGKSASVIGFHLRRMPPEPVDNPGGLGDETYTAILAYILQANGFEPGANALPGTLATLADVTIPAKEGAAYEPDLPAADAAQSKLLESLPPVTAEKLRNPPPEDWLLPSRTYDAQTFSPLTDITKENVKYLGLAWRAPLRPGVSMPMPLVHHGVMFLQTAPDATLALDATNGKVLWRYQHTPKGPSSQKMGLALSGDKVLVPTSDLHVIALSAKTGELIWDHEIAKESTLPGRGAYQLRSPPLVVGDKVLQGVTASFIPKGGFVVALDLATGEEKWRFHTIARPGEPNGDSWNEVPLEKRSGGSVWHELSYDPTLDLVYFGIAPTYDTGPLVHPVEKDGVTSAALYTNCTVALRPETGELVWYYQHMPNDQWDLDWVFERTVFDLPTGNGSRRAVMNVGKMAVVEALDAKTGTYLFSVDSGLQNVITSIDPETGEKTIDPNRWPDPERPTDICPSAYGARSWPQTAYSPETHLLYLPLTESCMRLGKEGARLLTSGVGIGRAVHPDSADGKLGRLTAVDVTTRKLAWNVDLTMPVTTGVVATAGGVLFVGDMDPSLKAFDASTGELLWTGKLDDSPSSSVITYKVGERQYVAVVVGFDNFHIGALEGTSRGNYGGEAPAAPTRPQGGAAIWVYGL